MKVTRFGETDLRVSGFGLGCARIGGIFQRESGGFLEVLAAAKDRGINFFDTADMYSQGESETLLGRAFRKQRDRVIIASKAGYCLPAQRKFVAKLKPLARPVIRWLGIRRDQLPTGVRGALTQDFSPRYLKRAVEGSLRRLRTDYLDILQLHSPPAEIVERGDWVRALEDLKRAGKIRYFGVSCDTVEAGTAALRVPGVSSLQCLVNLLEPSIADALVPTARERGIGVIARECLANGLLIKDASEISLKDYCQSPEEEARRAEQLATFRMKAQESERTLAGLALDSVSRREGVSVALIGVRTVAQLGDVLRHVSD